MITKLPNVIMYQSGKEKGSVAFDIIRVGKIREYIRIAPGGMGFLSKGIGNIKIIGIDDL
jgi:hypothetical protein